MWNTRHRLEIMRLTKIEVVFCFNSEINCLYLLTRISNCSTVETKIIATRAFNINKHSLTHNLDLF